MTQLSLLAHDGRTRQTSTNDEYDVYAGRPRGGREPRDVPIGAPGWLGNSHPLDRTCPRCRVWHTPEESHALFHADFLGRVGTDAAFRAAVLALATRRIGCPGCVTGAPLCHVRVIVDWIERVRCA